MAETIRTELTQLLGITYPIILAGMNKVSGPKLAAAVSNAGGLGVIGGLNLSPRILRATIKTLKKNLASQDLPFGVDLALPQVGGSARKTNYDYTKGKLDELIDVICDYAPNCKLFVCAIGVPPVQAVKKLHASNILVMNMVGALKHIPKAIANGVDIICCQGGEGGGHTGEIATTVLLPQSVDLCKQYKMTLYPNRPVLCVGAGGIYDGRSLAMALNYGAQAVWVGTRFICSDEGAATQKNKQAIVDSTPDDTIKTLVYSGRPLRMLANKYTDNWEKNRKQEMRDLLESGVIPLYADAKTEKKLTIMFPFLCGQIGSAIKDIKPAKAIVEDMMTECIKCLRENINKVTLVSKL